jgi:hypothetical protein
MSLPARVDEFVRALGVELPVVDLHDFVGEALVVGPTADQDVPVVGDRDGGRCVFVEVG